MMAAGGDGDKITPTSARTVEQEEETTEENELQNLDAVLNQLEHCVDKLDQEASTLTNKIKEFLQESNSASQQTPSAE